ncbi:peptidase U32 family protein [Lysinibacillus sp. UGB7]|uniref:peptidase U32 family protein n=1 Tax=Lysinibacillus sp. UGB7 TaxID=3411039 RepID=UPI003B773890
MDNLKMVAPVRSKFMMEEMIEAGANEIYFGVSNPLFQQMSFDNKFQTVADYPAHFSDWDDLDDIMAMAKAHQIKVIFMANTPFIPNSLETSFQSHVYRALEKGVDAITISSMQSLNLLKNVEKNIQMISGSQLAPVNKYGAEILTELGVRRITISQSMTLEEIQSLRNLDVELMITGNFGTGSIANYCRLWESPNNNEMGEGVRTLYRLLSPLNNQINQHHILDSATDCSLCNLEDLVSSGVTAIKFIGREAPNPVTLAMVVNMFNEWKEMGVSGFSIEQKMKVMEQEQLMWIMKWVPRFCEKCRCSYKSTAITKTYI